VTKSKNPAPSTTRWLEKRDRGELESIRPEHKQEPHELPQWVKTALVRRLVESMTYAEAAAEFSKAGPTLEKYGSSPAAKKWMEGLREFMSDPIAVAKAILAGSALNVTLDRFVLYEKAKALDIGLADKIAKDLQALGGIVAPKETGGALVVKVQLSGGASPEVPMIEADWELVEPKKVTSGDGT
jgi:hypothetical protein